MRSRKIISVARTGTLTYLADPDLQGLTRKGVATTTRASHIEPVGVVRRWWFHTLRWIFGENGQVGKWTRRWKCCWRVNMAPSGGPVICRCWTRDLAILAEQQWLQQHLGNLEAVTRTM